MAPKLVCMLGVRLVYLFANGFIEDCFTNDNYWNSLNGLYGVGAYY